jgi:alkylation response protein AidB-like acyl-CoA dehydrogenase
MLDYVSLEDELTAEERLIRDTAREFVQEEICPDIGEHFLEGTYPVETIPKMGELGFFGPTFEGYGLPNIGQRAYGLIMAEFEACDSGVRSMASVQSGLVMYPIYTYGSEAQKEEWLPKLGTGEAIGCFGLTEPEHGSDPASMETRAEPDGSDWILNGSKTWITNSPIADVAIVWARDVTEPEDTVRGFIVETDRDGVTTSELEDKISFRASSTGEIHLQDVVVPDENRLPGVEGMKGPLSCLTQARYGIAWGAVGAAKDAFETALTYAQDREQFGNPIASYQIQQEKFAELATQITLAELLVFRLAELKEAGDLRHEQVSMAKRNNVRMARKAALVTREILGANGITVDYSPMRHLANMETVYTYEGTHDIHSLIVGRDLTGYSAFV